MMFKFLHRSAIISSFTSYFESTYENDDLILFRPRSYKIILLKKSLEMTIQNKKGKIFFLKLNNKDFKRFLYIY